MVYVTYTKSDEIYVVDNKVLIREEVEDYLRMGLGDLTKNLFRKYAGCQWMEDYGGPNGFQKIVVPPDLERVYAAIKLGIPVIPLVFRDYYGMNFGIEKLKESKLKMLSKDEHELYVLSLWLD